VVSPSAETVAQTLDKLAIMEVSQTERAARDMAQWDRMLATYHPDSSVRVSWFDGTGPEFVEASRVMFESGTQSVHEVGTTLVQLSGFRAIADTGCAIHVRSRIHGVEADTISYCRHRSRVEKRDGVWGLVSFYAVYQRDEMAPTNPADTLTLDLEQLATFRSSYQFLAYFGMAAGYPAKTDLPGFDRPDLVEQHFSADQAWLATDHQ
jgi:hypothetical protein